MVDPNPYMIGLYFPYKGRGDLDTDTQRKGCVKTHRENAT